MPNAGRNPNTLVHTLRALHPRTGVPIRHVLRKLWSSPDFKSQGARSVSGRRCSVISSVYLHSFAEDLLSSLSSRSSSVISNYFARHYPPTT